VLIAASSSRLHLLTFQRRADGNVSLDVRGAVEDVDALALGLHTASPDRRCSLYSVYWYTSTNTDAARRSLMGVAWLPKPDDLDFEGNPLAVALLGSQFTCFTGTKVQILTLRHASHIMWRTQYHIFSVYLLYWRKSTNTEAASHIQRRTQYDISVSSEIMAILALADSLAGTLALVA